MSNILNEFFINIEKRLSMNFSNLTKNNLVKAYNTISFDNLFSKKIVNSEVIEIVRNCKDDTTAGLDKVTIKLIKYIIELLVTYSACFHF